MGSETHVIGLLSVKQKPPTAGGMCFLTLEDETGFFNMALGPEEYEKYRLVIQTGCLIAARACVERSAPVDPQDPRTAAVSLRVRELWCPGLGQKKVGRLDSKPRDFR
jgi:DNA polymerase III alpha subunit